MNLSSEMVAGGDDRKDRNKPGKKLGKSMKSNIASGSETVSVHTIERDLHNLWEQMAKVSEAEHREPVMRACVLNLIVHAGGEQSAGEVGQVMADVTTEHPSRIIVMLPNPEAPQAHLIAWVTAQCHLAAGGRKQVCSEQIMITADGGAADWLPSLVRPLLVPDLPVVLWWRDSPFIPSRLFDALLETVDRVIVDATTLGDPLEGLANLTVMIKRKGRWTAFSDLSWGRLTPWRDLIAGFFDVPDYRPYVWRLNRVEIECTKKRTDHQVIPVPALLIMGWLASRLRWKIKTRPQWTDADTCQLELTVDNKPILTYFKTPPTTDDAPVGLSAIRLSGEGQPQFVVSRSEDGLHLHSSIELGEKRVLSKISSLDGRSEAQLISRELEILSRDTVYEQALDFVSGLRYR